MEKETVEEKFRRLSRARLIKTMKQIQLLANLGGYNYHGTREDKDFVTNTLRKGLDELEYRYSGDKGSNNVFKVNIPSEPEIETITEDARTNDQDFDR